MESQYKLQEKVTKQQFDDWIHTMKLTGEEARNVVYNDHDDWKPVKGTRKTEDHERWTVGYTEVFEHIPTKKFYSFYWTKGATEHQDQSAYEDEEEVEPYEVVRKLVQTEQWVSPESPGLTISSFPICLVCKTLECCCPRW